MTTRTDDQRYLNELTYALQLQKLSGARIGEILAEVEVHVAQSGESARNAFGDPQDYARQFALAPADNAGRAYGGNRYRGGAWSGIVTAAIGGWLLASGTIAGMTGETEIGLPGWWAAALGAAIMIGTFALVPINAIIDPRRPDARRYGRRWLLSWVIGAIVVIVLVLVAIMLIFA